MAQTEFYHGNEIKEQKSNTMVISGADISVIGVVGTAPIFMVQDEYKKINEPIQVNNSTEAIRYFGRNLSEYTIPDAIETILTESEGAKIYVVNVFDPEKHKADLTTSLTFEDNKIKLNESGIFNLSLKKESTELVLNQDYTFENNVIEIKEGGALTAEDTVNVSYSYADPSKVTAGDIIGTIDEFEIKTGLKALEDIESLYGDSIGIVISPTYEGLEPVAKAIEAFCEENDAYAYTNAPLGTTKTQAIQGRGAKGDINFNTVCKDRMLLAHYVQRYNSNLDKYEMRPLSPVFAGLRVKIDREEGIQTSISNNSLKTVTGLEYPVSFKMGKTNTDANDLNSKGISCVINQGGYRSFGTRSANFPTENGIETFECCRRVDKYIKKSILQASFATVDKAITSGMINGVVDSVNAFLDNLKDPLRQVIIDGKCWYDASLNPPDELATGWVKFCYEFCPPPPAERATFYRTINIQLLSNLGAA